MAYNNDSIRSQFPSLSSGYIFADNAGGSQCSGVVIKAITDYLSNTNVQLGASYSVGLKSTSRVELGQASTAALFNASSVSEVIFSNSSTQLAENLARALESGIPVDSGLEFIATYEHETNVGPWQRLAQRTKNKFLQWKPTLIRSNGGGDKNPFAVEYALESLLPLLSAKTKLVAISACSNILGTFTDVKKITQAIRETVQQKSGGNGKVEIVVDCVAYAPHRRIDVQDWDIDYAFFSYYKVYGPHMAAMYIRKQAREVSLRSIAHYFITDPSNQFQLGGPGYELTYATSEVLQYLLAISSGSFDRHLNLESDLITRYDASSIISRLEASFAAIASHERLLVDRLLFYLTAQEQWDAGIRVVGSSVSTERAPTISFVIVEGKNGEPPLKSQDVVVGVDRLGNIGIRYGHFYAARLIELLGFPEDDGIIRVSLVHYNTVNEVDEIISALKQAISSCRLALQTGSS
ncbi:PLP-dependent transferase [Serendipita vermifera]|nr:PLP-dependent transferase [Serendipita vermifera]